MITALVSSLVGIVGGTVPDVIKEIKDTRDHKREIEFLKLQHELQLKSKEAGVSSKIEEQQANVVIEETRAIKEHISSIIEQQFKPTGVPWIDALNSAIRPVTAALIMLLFIGVAIAYTVGIMQAYANDPSMTLVDLSNAIWYSLIGESVQAVLGFLFGYRSRLIKTKGQGS